METFKQGEITARIDERGIDLGNINVNFYTMDNSTAALDIHIKKRNIFSEKKEFIPVNLNQTIFKPVLHLIAEDGSIFTNEELEVIKAEEGYVRYNVSDYVTRHVGRVQAKLFLIDEDSSTDDSSHIADFYFKVNDSGITKAIGKEIHVDMLDDIVERILLKDIERFRGPKGDKGDTGPQGPKGEKGDKGDKGEPGIDGNDGLSAYQIAKEYGYSGTEQEWLDSLKLSATNQQMEDIKSQIVNSINKPTIINTPTCASRDRVVETDLRRLKDYGLQFTSFVDGYITSFDVFSSGDGVTDFYLTDYGGNGIPANVEYKRIRRKLSAGWNTIEFVNKIESNKEYCLAVSFTDDISLAVASKATYDAENTQNPHLIKPNMAYKPPYGNTGTAYLFIFNVQVSIDNDSRLILNQLTNNTFEVSNVEPSNDTSIWIKPQSNGG